MRVIAGRAGFQVGPAEKEVPETGLGVLRCIGGTTGGVGVAGASV